MSEIPAWLFYEDVSITFIREDPDAILKEILITRCWSDFKKASSDPSRVAIVLTFLDDQMFVNGKRSYPPMSELRYVCDMSDAVKEQGTTELFHPRAIITDYR